MKRLSIKQVLAGSMAFFVLSTSVVIAGLWASSWFEWFNVELKHYVGLPLLAWVLAGTNICLALIGRLLRNIDGRPEPIKTITANPAGRAIPYHHGGKTSQIFASVQKWAVGNDQESIRESQKRIATHWVVPVDSENIVISEAALSRFLQLAQRRKSHQFSRNYWTKKRKPSMPRQVYEAHMRLLSESGLISGRQFGASGFLPPGVKVHNAVTHLKFESQYRL